MSEAGNDPDRFDRLPATEAERSAPDRPTREGVLAWWNERFSIDPGVFANHGFWERGAGKIWALRDDLGQPTPVEIEGLGMTALRTRQQHWKPTLEAAQRFGNAATRNVIELSDAAARAFFAGEDQEIPWDGDWGYLLVAHELAGDVEPVGVGLYVRGELRSQVPKGRRRDL